MPLRPPEPLAGSGSDSECRRPLGPTGSRPSTRPTRGPEASGVTVFVATTERTSGGPRKVTRGSPNRPAFT
eukprot:5135196-Pyramimonas_sp.AAC.1